jgi:hypothetical protein
MSVKVIVNKNDTPLFRIRFGQCCSKGGEIRQLEKLGWAGFIETYIF